MYIFLYGLYRRGCSAAFYHSGQQGILQFPQNPRVFPAHGFSVQGLDGDAKGACGGIHQLVCLKGFLQGKRTFLVGNALFSAGKQYILSGNAVEDEMVGRMGNQRAVY